MFSRRTFFLFAIISALAVSAVSEDGLGFMLPEPYRANPSSVQEPDFSGPFRLEEEEGLHERARTTKKKIFLKIHNQVRKQYHARRLTWDDKLAKHAKKWGKRCEFKHSHGPYGENLYASVGKRSASAVVRAWAAEVKNYDPKKPGFSMAAGHFTQVVWADTRKLGCATVTCTPEQLGFGAGYSSVAQIVVCNYSPPGNYAGQFEANVKV